MKSFYFPILLILALIQTSCTVQSFVESDSTPELSSIHTHIPPAQTKTPSLTPTPSLTSTLTQTRFATPTIEPTLLSKIERLEELVDQNPQLKNYYNRNCMIGNTRFCTYGSIISPNQEWVAIFDAFDKSGGYRLVNLDTLVQWKISYLQVEGEGHGTGNLQIEHWSADGQYLYLSPQKEVDGGDFWFWRDYIELIRLDLSSGVWVHTNMGPVHAFSPDDGKIVYRSGNSVVVRKLRNGEEFVFPIPSEYVKFGDFVWSEDSNQILFAASINKETDSVDTIQNGFTIYLLDLTTSKLTPVLENDARLLHPIMWESNHEVLLAGFYDYSCNADTLDFCDELYLLDTSTGTVKEKK